MLRTITYSFTAFCAGFPLSFVLLNIAAGDRSHADILPMTIFLGSFLGAAGAVVGAILGGVAALIPLLKNKAEMPGNATATPHPEHPTD